jgi:AcrR family transcriptional regulator
MAARAHSVDPRAERVRTRLREAAFALAHERRVDEITVGDIVARAEVSRQVFYQHFTDRDDAVATAFTAAFSSATADMGSLDSAAVDARARILRLFDFAAEHRSMYRNIVPSAVTQRVVTAFRAELQPACVQIARQGMPVVSPIASLTPESVTRFLVGGFMEVLRSWMEDPDSTDLSGRVGAALDTVNALLGLTTHSKGSQHG